MDFNKHYGLEGRHAFLSPSTYHWMNYDQDKLDLRYTRHLDAYRGTQLHELAHRAIQLGVRLGRTKQTLNMYVNDAISFRMKTEQILYYSDNCFGTADAISFRKNLLRISDLKNGVSKTSMNQLIVYVALFCLEYGYRPSDIEIELRIYQNNEIEFYVPEVEEIVRVMDVIVNFDRRIDELKAQFAV